MSSEDKVLAVVLGGGRGTRLYPLTKMRSKPAVPIAGKYRLIDIPISNCINSGIYRIALLTQFNSVSLHRHIARTYHFDAFHQGWVQIWAAEQTFQFSDWYQGTADAVRKQLFEIRSTQREHVLILAGDHLYRMDYAKMTRFHLENDADITVAVQPVRKEDSSRFGLLKRNQDLVIERFAEKPKDPEVLKDMISRDDPERPFLGSMGIYLFKTEVLIELLESTSFDDFGKHVLPFAINTKKIYGYDFEGYWEDIGTIRSFYETNLALACPEAPFSFYDSAHPIYTHARFLPGSVLENTCLENVMLAEGCTIKNANIKNSVIGMRSQIGPGVKIKDTVLMGADYYEKNIKEQPTDIQLGIGRNSDIEGAIIDKNPRIGENVIIRPFPRGTEIDEDLFVVRDGIVVISKNSIIPPNTVISPDQEA
ncbi:MAG: glucose-1-phosphate adenylyltransferase [Anaerolineaceae bacterium]|nr:glucose-1-phosphate adenylyltransferase [Anaerolineaceae bacterium]